jgi:16S rRNA (guanine966-N2)-methyltransferase
MRLRITSGFLGGRSIIVPRSSSEFRPTLEKNRAAVAEIIKHRIAEARAGDFCSGSGAFGFEMLSRGAREVHFVEKHRSRAHAIADNAVTLGVESNCRIFPADIRSYLRRCRQLYSIIFFDPPYDHPDLLACGPLLAGLLAPDGVLIVEHRRQTSAAEAAASPPDLCLEQRRYGDTTFDFFTRKK